jgi:DNA-binding transcriptional LysR family regulator
MQDHLCLVCPTDHPLALIEAPYLADLALHPFIALNRDSDAGQLLEKLADKSNVKLNTTFDVTHMSTLIGMVRSGLGITVVSKLKMSAFDSDKLTVRALMDAGTSYDVGVVTPVQRTLASPLVALREELIFSLRTINPAEGVSG